MDSALSLLSQGASAVYALLDEKQWAALSAAGTALQALIALAALFYVGAQLRAGRKAGDLQALQELFNAVTEREQALLRSRDKPDEQDAAFLEFMNFLELRTVALNGGLLGRYPKKILREKIIDSLAVIEGMPEWQQRFIEAKSSATAFEHLQRFARKNRKAINRVKAHMMAKAETAPEGGSGSAAG
ncbi:MULTISPECIES: hypothetical protein [Methylorubrum]|uniref:Uncharacterized protein n=1 Tax=Methylorubrum thiocyanatum TaxID=47958 RepID=A0AA40S7U1_9HYPH|nr:MULTISPECIES: hypothetical protein [Methylorubrum]MBA8916048.1 hypothetical protein [Methylorubrum thiocyanatum]UGB28624.1 hypothetical protein LPC10_25070 [Methylorubrum sp. B1-46]GMA80044.1 hypothetical protein GCM10025880_64610 [Methylorubrum aminovorans]GMA80107.1 hypothetical protein GCM10025880_65240 [Methylorubrum aminovorans]